MRSKVIWRCAYETFRLISSPPRSEVAAKTIVFLGGDKGERGAVCPCHIQMCITGEAVKRKPREGGFFKRLFSLAARNAEELPTAIDKILAVLSRWPRLGAELREMRLSGGIYDPAGPS
jgi:hypothetical protein